MSWGQSGGTGPDVYLIPGGAVVNFDGRLITELSRNQEGDEGGFVPGVVDKARQHMVSKITFTT